MQMFSITLTGTALLTERQVVQRNISSGVRFSTSECSSSSQLTSAQDISKVLTITPLRLKFLTLPTISPDGFDILIQSSIANSVRYATVMKESALLMGLYLLKAAKVRAETPTTFAGSER